jgi:hypothetical protein
VSDKNICFWKKVPRFLVAVDRLAVEKFFADNDCGSAKAFFESYLRRALAVVTVSAARANACCDGPPSTPTRSCSKGTARSNYLPAAGVGAYDRENDLIRTDDAAFQVLSHPVHAFLADADQTTVGAINVGNQGKHNRNHQW